MEHRRLKILFITPWYPSQEHPVVGVFVQEHARAVQLYDDVVVFHCQRRDDLRKPWDVVQEVNSSLAAGLPTYRVLHRRAGLPNLSFLFELGSVLYGLRHVRRRGFRPDIVHGHTYTSGAVATVVAKLLGKPTVVTEHSSEFPRRKVRGAGVWKARLAFRHAAIVLPVSLTLKQAIEAYGISARFQVIPNVVDTDLFRPAGDSGSLTKRLLAVALLGPSNNKGIPDLLRALGRVKAQRSDWHLDIVGDGPARSEYEQLAKDLNLVEDVAFHGNMPKPQVARLMQKSDLFVLPSWYETFSVVTAEAMAVGLPVLITRCGGPEEFVCREVGMTVPVNDIEALSSALSTMLDTLDSYSPTYIADYAAMRFSHQAVGAELHNLYLRSGQPYAK